MGRLSVDLPTPSPPFKAAPVAYAEALATGKTILIPCYLAISTSFRISGASGEITLSTSVKNEKPPHARSSKSSLRRPCRSGTNAPYRPEGAPELVVRARSAAFGACLAEDLVATSSEAGRENRDLLVGDIKRGRPSRGCDHECIGHGNPLILFRIPPKRTCVRPPARSQRSPMHRVPVGEEYAKSPMTKHPTPEIMAPTAWGNPRLSLEREPAGNPDVALRFKIGNPE
jgi:hypothetical protein